MRYGIIREGEGLPTGAAQRADLKQNGCGVILDAGRAEEQRRLYGLLLRLGPGDEVLVYRLDDLQRPAGDLVQLIRHMSAKGAVLRIDDGEGGFVAIAETNAARRLVELLAEVEDRLRARPNPKGTRRESRGALTRYQVDYARKLFRQGAPLRTIGLIFQLPPTEIWELISEAGA